MSVNIKENGILIPVSGGSNVSNNIYDGNEHVIGTWFGKPLYRKVISQTLTQSNTNTFVDLITFNDGNIKKIDGYLTNQNDYYIPLTYAYYSGSISGSAYRIYNNTIQVVGLNSDWRTWEYVFIIEYTKATD